MPIPLKLSPAFQHYLWGGTRLRGEYGKQSPRSPVAESWEISCHPDGPSVVNGGPYDGRTLAGLLAEHPDQIGAGRREFPLLVKLIDAAESLSIQVHPGDEYARRVERQQGKNEMWYVVEAQPGARLILGLQRPIEKSELRQRIEQGTLEQVLRSVPVKAGDCYCVPAGMLHAIGGGLLVAEVQQNSNITYRVYDFGRKNPDGTLRELHVEKALDVIDTALQSPNTGQAVPVRKDGYSVVPLTSWQYFTASLLEIGSCALLACGPQQCQCLLCVQGAVDLLWPGGGFRLAKGDSAFVPAGCGEYRLEGRAKVLYTQV